MKSPWARCVRIAGAGAITLAAGCVQWFAEDVAAGAARLTIRNLAAVATLAADDETCGLGSDAATLTLDGTLGGRGSATWSITRCRISLAEMTPISTDCFGAETSARGTIVVTATQTVRGRLTGDPKTPVVPDEIDAAELRFTEILFDDFEVRSSASEAALTIRSGTLSATMKPRMAAETSMGACAIVTPHVVFEEIHYRDAQVRIDTGSRVIEAPIPVGDLRAQNGVGPLGENFLGGTLALWDSDPLPVPNDGGGLDPDYDPIRFRHGFACEKDLRLPLTDECDITQGMGAGAARLSIRNIATIASAASNDTVCGFASPAAIDGAEWEGTVGERGGRVTYTITDCVLDFGASTLTDSNCLGVDTLASGRAVVSGTMVLEGYLTGDPQQPAVPTSQQPAVINITARVTDFVARTSASDKALLIESGTLSGIVSPLTAVDETLGACSLPTAHATVSSVRTSDATALLQSGDMKIGITLEDSEVNAVNGRVGNYENHIEGWVTLEGTEVWIPTDDNALDPDYEPNLFLQGFNCDPNMRVPRSNADCDFDSVLAHGVARLTIMNYVLALKALAEDSTCGFDGIDGVLPEDLIGEPNGELTARWYVDGCEVSAPSSSPILIRDDCIGTRTHLSGSFSSTAVKQATGVTAAANPPILPSHPKAVLIDAQNVILNELAIWDEVDDPEESRYLVMHDGYLSGQEWVHTAPALLPAGAYIMPTPVIEYDGIRLMNSHVTLHVGPKQFHLTIEDSDLDAFNGTYGGQHNKLTGRIRMNGRWHTIPPEFADDTLDPAFDQEEFDASYACDENLASVLPSAP